MTLSKSDVAAKVAESIGISKIQVAAVIDSFIHIIMDEVRSGNSISIRQFGTFEMRERAEKVGVNPKTKEPIVIPARKTAGFKTSARFRDYINSCD